MENVIKVKIGCMKKILVFGASTSSKSINVQLAKYAASLLHQVELTTIDLNDFEMPIYSTDREAEGFPEAAQNFVKLIGESDGVLLSLAEHNGTYTAAFKNVLDWSSRVVGGKLWQNKPMLILSSSPGGRGGATVMNLALNHWPFMAAAIKANFSLPMFQENFDAEKGIITEGLKNELLAQIAIFEKAI